MFLCATNFLNKEKKLIEKKNPNYGTDMQTWEYRL